LLVLTKSVILQAQLRRECAGTILAAASSGSLKRILVPAIDDKNQHEIASLIQRSRRAREKAHELLYKAKNEVERAIERTLGMKFLTGVIN
jgi:hypothetical protein